MSMYKHGKELVKQKRQSKQTAMQEHMAKIRAMRGKGGGKRKGGRWKKLTSEVKTLRKDLGSAIKLIGKMAKKQGVLKPKPRAKKRRR
jgi:hypothetical protein